MIGGYAVNHYGFSRVTIDVDFMIAANDLDAEEVRAQVPAGPANQAQRYKIRAGALSGRTPRAYRLRIMGSE